MKNTAQGEADYCICLETHPRVLYFSYRQASGALIDILYFCFASTLSCLNKISGMRTSFHNLSPRLKLMLRVKFLAE